MTPVAVTDDILGKLGRPGAPYFMAVAGLLAVLGFGVYAFAYQTQVGLGVAGYQPPILWGVYITNFVFWIGITHSGTLISAVLFLFRARWRTGVARASEAMTVFAIMTGALFPIVHLGRPWLFYWLLPIPNERGLWVNFRSPIIWDLFAIMTYMTVSVVFLYVGLLPDIATARDRLRDWRRPLYRLLALGWYGSDRQRWHYNSLYGLLAALAVPLAVSVHSVVSWDFATTLLPGWHSTIFAPYFVAGAIFSGVAMMITLLVPMRALLGLEAYMRVRHFDNLGKLLLVMSLLLSYCYAAEYFTAWYSGSPYELGTYLARLTGAYAPLAWTMLACNSAVPLLLFSRRVRTSLPALLAVAVLVNVGMWLERYVIVVSSLATNFDPATWTGLYQPTWVEGAITAASFALFLLLFLVFVRLFPPVAMNEIEEQAEAEAADHAPAEAVPRPASPVRWCTLTGALIGCAAGIALPVYTMQAWPLVVGGKPLVSIPPVVIIAFELSMLGAALGGLIGFLALGGLARPRRWMRGGAAAAAVIWIAGCAPPPDMNRGAAAGPYDRPLLPAEGALAVDGPRVADRPAALNRLENPRPASPAVQAEGAALYRIYCAVCHGADGAGDSLLADYLPRLPDLRSPAVQRRSDGRLYAVIRNGGFRMPAYGDALSEGERWAVVHHLRTFGGGDGQ